MSWDTAFDDPIILPDGKRLITLRDAIGYLARTVPKRERNHDSVQTAATILTQAAEGRDFILHARIATLKVIRRHAERPPREKKIRPKFRPLKKA